MSVRVRFAPSPTGYLHVGGLRTALYNYLFAKHNNGTFVLRIEDTDRTRFVENATENLIDSLKWSGIDFDEGPGKDGGFGPYIQSERTEIYKKHAAQLIESGMAYYAFDTPEEIDEMRKRLQKDKKNLMYDRDNMKNQLTLGPDEVKSLLEAGTAHVVRLKVPHEKEIVFNDIIRGEVTVSGAEVDDQVLIKSDGFPTYHLANVVDDHLMEISHVIRGVEWLPSTPKHVLLYDAFGWDRPQFAHLPLLLNKNKKKLSKRNAIVVENLRQDFNKSLGELESGADTESVIKDMNAILKVATKEFNKNGAVESDKLRGKVSGAIQLLKNEGADAIGQFQAVLADAIVNFKKYNAVEVEDYRDMGFFKEALVNFTALLGWNPSGDREIYTFDELKDSFNLEKVNKGDAIFDTQKFEWMNAQYLRSFPMDALAKQLASELTDKGFGEFESAYLQNVITLFRERISFIKDLPANAPYMFKAPEEYEAKYLKKRWKDNTAELIQPLIEMLKEDEDFSHEHTHELTSSYVEEKGLGLGDIVHPLRLMVTGMSVGAGMFETMETLGKTECMDRIDNFIEKKRTGRI